MFRKVPLIVILGSTGTGKTKLSIELAQKFNGEIISADAMQLYNGLNIVTAKATKEEQMIVPHHLLDVANPGIPFTIVNYRNMALPIIDDLLLHSKVPIVVGGTNYYIESLIWQVLINPPLIKENLKRTEFDDNDNNIDVIPSKRIKTRSNNKDETSSKNNDDIFPSLDELLKLNVSELELISSNLLHEHLKSVDLISANRLHPNNKRKIIRALEVFMNSGISLSSILDEQRNIPGGSLLGGPLRYPHVIIFWLKCDQEILNGRLDSRIDAMLAEGLLNEIREFYENFVVPYNQEDNYTKGILQTIGFKEFSSYLKKYDKHHDELINEFLLLKNKKDVKEPDGLPLFKKCLEELKLVTKRYSKKQIKWVNNRLLGSKERQVPSLYELNTSEPKQWNINVYGKAENIIDSYINDKPIAFMPMNNIDNPREGMNEEVSNVCEICDRIFIGEYQWNIHLKSKKHKKVSASKKKKE